MVNLKELHTRISMAVHIIQLYRYSGMQQSAWILDRILNIRKLRMNINVKGYVHQSKRFLYFPQWNSTDSTFKKCIFFTHNLIYCRCLIVLRSLYVSNRWPIWCFSPKTMGNCDWMLLQFNRIEQCWPIKQRKNKQKILLKNNWKNNRQINTPELLRK